MTNETEQRRIKSMIPPNADDVRSPIRPWLVALLISLVALTLLIVAQLPAGPVVRASTVNLDQTALSTRGQVIAPPDANRPVVLTPRVYAPVVLRYFDQTIPPYGVQQYNSLSAANGLTRAVESRVSWIRVPLYWDSIEPVNTTPANYNWAALDASLQNGRNAGMHIILTLSNNPAWAAARYNGPVTNTADLQQFIGAAVARYPDVTYWEIYNEPDDPIRFGADTTVYANMLQALYPVIKAANSNAQVVFGGLALDFFPEDGGNFNKTFLQQVLAACSGPCFDLANFHYYPVFRKRWEPYGRDIIGKANYVRQVLAQYNYVRPVINTETGWPEVLGGAEIMARWVPKTFVRTQAAGLPFAIWYSLVDADASNPGLLDSTMTPRPAYYAFSAMTAILAPARYVRAIPSSETGSTFIEGYQFIEPSTVSGKRLDVYWYDCTSMVVYQIAPTDCSNTAPLKIPASRIARIDKSGASTIVNDADDGKSDGLVTLTVSSSPIYIDYQP
jgi:hypothetical protein